MQLLQAIALCNEGFRLESEPKSQLAYRCDLSCENINKKVPLNEWNAQLLNG